MLGSDVQSVQYCDGRFVHWVLRDEFAADGEVEDGLAQLLDVFGAGGEAREVVEVKAGGVAQGGGVSRRTRPW